MGDQESHNATTSTPAKLDTIHPSGQAYQTSHRPRPSLIPILVLGTVFLSSAALLPYVLVRQRLASLQQQVAQAASAHAAVRRDVRILLTENSTMRGRLGMILQSLEENQAGVARLADQVQQGDVLRAEAESRVHGRLDEVTRAVQRAEVDAAKRDQAGAEWRHKLLDNFGMSWPKK